MLQDIPQNRGIKALVNERKKMNLRTNEVRETPLVHVDMRCPFSEAYRIVTTSKIDDPPGRVLSLKRQSIGHDLIARRVSSYQTSSEWTLKRSTTEKPAPSRVDRNVASVNP